MRPRACVCVRERESTGIKHCVITCNGAFCISDINLSVLLTKYYSGDHIKNNACEACCTYGGQESAYRVLVGKPEGKRPLGRLRRRWAKDIKSEFREVGIWVWNGFSFRYWDLWWRRLAVQVGKTKDQGLYNKPSAAVHPGALAAGTLPQYNTI